MQTYRFDKYWLLIVLLAFVGYLPVVSLHEIITTGTIDTNAIGRGRHEIPVWILYLIGWSVFIYFSVVFFLPAFGSIIRGYVFKCDGDTLIIKDSAYEKVAIKSYKFTLLRGTCLETEHGQVTFHRSLNSQGVRVMEDFLKGIQKK